MNDWKGNIIFSYGPSNSKGVAILISLSLDMNISDTKRDQDGRISFK